MLVRAGICACACGLAVIALPAQSPPMPAAQPPTFRSDTRLVRISVVVHDKGNQPVDGLTAEDFRLLDNGREQSIALFDVERRAAAPIAAATADANVFSNAIKGRAAGGVTVVLFDRLNTPWSDQQRARDHIFKYLSQVSPSESVAFYVLDSSAVRIVHDFTRDTSSLRRALDRVRLMPSREASVAAERPPEVPSSGDAQMDAMTEAALVQVDQMVKMAAWEHRVEASLNALEVIARRLSGIAGRKNLVWVSSAFPPVFSVGRFDTRKMDPEVNRAARAIADADVAVYPVDARGLAPTFAGPPGVARPAVTSSLAILANVDSMRLLADQTGGRVYVNTNDLGGAIGRAVDDSQILYVLAYYPSSGTWDGSFHEVKVMLRRPGLDVRHRTGYLALPAPRQDATTRQGAISRALVSPIDATGLQLTVTAAPADSGSLQLEMRVDTRALLFHADGDFLAASLDVVIAQALSDGRLLREVDTTVPLRIRREMRAQLDREGLVLKRQLDVRADAHELRIAVRDPASDAVGTLTIPASRVRDAVRRR